MYESFYRFDYRPFGLLPDSECIFWTEGHRNAFSVMEVGLDRLSQVIVLTGGIGTGKTTLIRQLLRTTSGDYSIGLLSNFTGDRGDLLRWLLSAFGQDISAASDAVLVGRLHRFLADQVERGRRSILIIDEAQNLSTEDLENLRLLSNLNANGVLLMLVLVGQPQLRARLTRLENRQICQRIGADYHLDALAPDDTKGYVRFRCTQAGGAEDLFDDAALDEIHRVSKGIPRKINVLCDLCLICAYAEGESRIGEGLVRSVLDDARRHGIYSSLTEQDITTVVERDLAVGGENDLVATAAGDDRPRDPLQRLTVVLEGNGRGTARFGSSSGGAGPVHGRSGHAPENDLGESTFGLLDWPEDALVFVDDPHHLTKEQPLPAAGNAAARRTDPRGREPIRTPDPARAGPAKQRPVTAIPAPSAPQSPPAEAQPRSAAPARPRRFWSAGRMQASPVGPQLERLRAAVQQAGSPRKGWRSARGIFHVAVNGSLAGGLVIAALAEIAPSPDGPSGAIASPALTGNGIAEPALARVAGGPTVDPAPIALAAPPRKEPDEPFIEVAAAPTGDVERQWPLLADRPSAFAPAAPAHRAAPEDAPFIVAAAPAEHRSAAPGAAGYTLPAPSLAIAHPAPPRHVPQSRTSLLAGHPPVGGPPVPAERIGTPNLQIASLHGIARSDRSSGPTGAASPQPGARPPASVPAIRVAAADALKGAPGDPSAPARQVAPPAEPDARVARNAVHLGMPAKLPGAYVPSPAATTDEGGEDRSGLPQAAVALAIASDPPEALDRDAMFRRALEIAIDAPTAAAVAYARAAVMGHARAAYYLGQIYETGDGLPVDFALARHWYEASTHSHRRAADTLAELPGPEMGGTLAPPVPLLAEPSAAGHVDLVWTSGEGADPASYVVEMAADPDNGAAVAHRLAGSAARLPLARGATHWRVLALDPPGGRYAVSEWQPIGRSDPGQSLPAGRRIASPRPSVTIAFSGEAAADAAALRASLRERGIPVQLSESAAAEAGTSSVRYFYDQDQASADAIAELVPGEVAPSLGLVRTGDGAAPVPGQVLVTLGSL